jgi:hypothetical protein
MVDRTRQRPAPLGAIRIWRLYIGRFGVGKPFYLVDLYPCHRSMEFLTGRLVRLWRQWFVAAS